MDWYIRMVVVFIVMYQTLSEIFKHDFQRQFYDLVMIKIDEKIWVPMLTLSTLDSAMDPTVFPVRAIVFHKINSVTQSFALNNVKYSNYMFLFSFHVNLQHEVFYFVHINHIKVIYKKYYINWVVIKFNLSYNLSLF